MQLGLQNNVLTWGVSGCHWSGPISSAFLPSLGHFPSSRGVWNRHSDWGNHRKSFFPGQFGSSESVPCYCSGEAVSRGDGGYSIASGQVLRDTGSESRWAADWLCEWQRQQELRVSTPRGLQCVNTHHPKNSLTVCQNISEKEVMGWGRRDRKTKTPLIGKKISCCFGRI